MTKIRLGVMALVCATSTAAAQPKVNTVELADRIVTKTAGIKEGEIVEISGGPQDLAFMEDLAVAVRKAGAFPIVIYWSETAHKKLIDAVPEKYDGQTNAAELAMAKTVNVRILLPAVRDASILEKLPPARQQKIAKANQISNDTGLKRNVRVIELDNQLAPSAARAKTQGVTEADLAGMYWAGIGADYTAIEAKGNELKAALAKGTEVRVTHPNGTDVKFKVKGKKVLASDGMLSPADIKAGGASVNVWLPAGEVYLVPVAGSMEGKIVDERMISFEKEITGVTAEIKKGKITNISAKTGWDVIKPRYDAAGPQRDEVGVFDIGINPNIKPSPKLETFVAAGTVTFTTGNNVWAGGTSKEPFGLLFQLTGTTVTLDGKAIVEAGSLK